MKRTVQEANKYNYLRYDISLKLFYPVWYKNLDIKCRNIRKDKYFLL
jgi:hypothetical protein